MLHSYARGRENSVARVTGLSVRSLVSRVYKYERSSERTAEQTDGQASGRRDGRMDTVNRWKCETDELADDRTVGMDK